MPPGRPVERIVMDWKVVVSAVLLVVVLVIALNLRKKIERNKDNEGMFRPYKLNVEGRDGESNDEDEDEDEDEDDDDEN